ncbi:MAG: holdfast anchor protein HfaD [Brevundimonas sp.]|uniref:holdfast anchor protein HfaD n=1 Tax=Brevundimonas sp. TaxID=1871086 RepID=UPI0026187BE9|nr:holdfast anchor protein HfaD [Brevundimonas sp.]MDI6623768.1 holdfast anchor protein HfaD [Brevundimonas sp.]MDQ7812674.1 holdfast anchor protein HfaD [Brevundimonas sp.]
MAKPARIRLAGTIAATALCAAAATEAAAQTPPPGGTIVLNDQLQLGDVFSHQTLNVVDAQEQVTVSTSAQGNSASGAVENGSITVQSDQDMRGDAVATTDMTLGGDTWGLVTATTQAGGNYLAVSAYDSDLTVDATQSNTGGLVSATSQLGDDDARLLGGAVINASAISNTVAMYGEGSAVGGTIDQSSSATVRAYNRIETQYIPAEASVSSQAIVNAVQLTSGQTSGQNLAIVQTSTGDFVEAESSANAGNAWDLAARARASANQAVLYNEGGSVVTDSRQDNTAFVRAAATTTAYDYGRAEAYARGAANELSVGNNDIYVEIDNSQFNSGGVDVTATFSGTNGYDVYVGAEAVGNSVTGFACSDCEGYLEARNTQTNGGDVSATANTTVAGSTRAVITGANSVGNSATFYVSRPSH